MPAGGLVVFWDNLVLELLEMEVGALHFRL